MIQGGWKDAEIQERRGRFRPCSKTAEAAAARWGEKRVSCNGNFESSPFPMRSFAEVTTTPFCNEVPTPANTSSFLSVKNKTVEGLVVTKLFKTGVPVVSLEV